MLQEPFPGLGPQIWPEARASLPVPEVGSGAQGSEKCPRSGFSPKIASRGTFSPPGQKGVFFAINAPPIFSAGFPVFFAKKRKKGKKVCTEKSPFFDLFFPGPEISKKPVVLLAKKTPRAFLHAFYTFLALKNQHFAFNYLQNRIFSY